MPNDIVIAAPGIPRVIELYPKEAQVIGYCRVAAGNDRVSEVYPEDILRNPVCTYITYIDLSNTRPVITQCTISCKRYNHFGSLLVS